MRRLDANSSRLRSLALILLLTGSIVPAHAQQQNPPTTRPVPVAPGMPPPAGDENDADPMARRSMEQQVQRRNTQRQQDILNDTAKLLELAQQLKIEVDKSRKDQMSVSVIKKAEEIEKLAKAVKEKMKGS
jgi:hypothetical protein